MMIATQSLTVGSRGLTQGKAVQVIWQIGVADKSFNEFALAPNEARRFAEVFGERVEFVVGETLLKRFPFIHPSAADTFWGGKPEIPFVIRFQLPHEPDEVYALHITLADTHERLASTMEVSLNGQTVWKRKMPLGNGRAFYGDPNGKPCAFTVPIRASLLRKGDNDLTIVLRDGSWVAYDALTFVRWHPLPLPEFVVRHETKWSAVVPDADAFASEEALMLPQKGGFHAIGDKGASVTVQMPLAGESFRSEFAFALVQGSVKLAFILPKGARGDAWRSAFGRDGETVHIGWQTTPLSFYVRPIHQSPFAIRHLPWLQITVEHQRERVFVTVRDGEKVLARMEAVHAPVPNGWLRWTALEDVTEWAVANLQVAQHGSRKQGSGIRRQQTQIPTPSPPSPIPFARFNRSTGELVLGNVALELCISTKNGINPNLLLDRRTGRRCADTDYCYGTPDATLPKLIELPKIVRHKNGSTKVTLIGQQDDLRIEHRFRVMEKALEEQLRITNTGDEVVPFGDKAFGFAKTLFDGKSWFSDLKGCRFVAIPYRREPETGAFQDFSVDEIVWRSGWFHVVNYPGIGFPIQRFQASSFGSEAWAWVDADGDHVLVIAKYSNLWHEHPAREESIGKIPPTGAMEWSLLEPMWVAGTGGLGSGTGQKMVLRFGGADIWKLGDPEVPSELKPGESFTFGVTRYIPCRGGWKGAFYAFRDWMESLGHKPPKDYNPPVHWNELYDNPLWWGADTPERRKQFYRREHMEEEAQKAAELGCEALYLDPGWDTSFASSVWADDRLGKQDEFVRMLKECYGLQLSLHTPLAGWCDVNAYPIEARRKSRDGQVLQSLCSASSAYLKTKAERLLKLCEDGASFLMFDGSAFTGECYDETHGHSVPLTRHEHCLAYLKLMQTVKRKFPKVLIELHDPIVAGVTVRYAPTYFFHALPHSFDELWGYEFMWEPMDDLLSGRAISLYYVRLAYSIPIYLHIDLRKDNENALMFWWYASTCQHLGVGGKHPDPKVWEAHKQAMRTYRRLKRFYTQGRFFGIDETVHAHVFGDRRHGRGDTGKTVAVLNIFNLAATEVEREVRFKLSDIGLPNDLHLHFDGVPYRFDGDIVTLWVRLSGLGHRLIEVQAGKRATAQRRTKR